jgi:leader peptidase (prepilin peptidase) / N-methyltransferase
MQELIEALRYLFEQSSAAWVTTVFVLGLFIGSFLNVVIHRLPIMLERDWLADAEAVIAEHRNRAAGSAAGTQPESAAAPTEAPAQPRYNLIVPRSACPKCGTLITASQNIPVVSWLLLGGRCASCKARISPRYPLIELATAVASALVAWRFGFGWYTAAALVLTWTLIAASAIDFDHQLLPDSLTLPLLWLGLLLTLGPAVPQLGLPVDPRSAIVGAIAGYLSLWSVYHVFRLVTGKEGMGYGDFKLLAAFGAWFGWQMLLPIVLVSALAGSVVGLALIVFRGRDHNIPMPYGPFLAAAGWIVLMWGDVLVGSYLHWRGLR